MDLPITDVLTVSVSQAPAGIGAFNTSNIGLITRENFGANFGDLGYKIYQEPTTVGQDFGTDSVTYAMAVAIFSQKPNILAGGGKLIVMPFSDDMETVTAAITRLSSLVQFFGVLVTEAVQPADLLTAADLIQDDNKIGFWPFVVQADIQSGGTADQLRTGSLDQNRALYYGSGVELDGFKLAAAYASRALSVDFSGSNTTITMHLKDLVGIQPDPTLTPTILSLAQAAGADVYASFQGVPKVFTAGANGFFDRVYNRIWFVSSIQIAGFNILAETSTKIVQTEQGLDVLKGAYRRVCEQAVANQYAAPGEWDDPNRFGNIADFDRNIEERGYYIYSQPVSQQDPTARAARQAPLVQIALKEAGAIHSAAVIVNINA